MTQHRRPCHICGNDEPTTKKARFRGPLRQHRDVSAVMAMVMMMMAIAAMAERHRL
jgi:hypothetical protein